MRLFVPFLAIVVGGVGSNVDMGLGTVGFEWWPAISVVVYASALGRASGGQCICCTHGWVVMRGEWSRFWCEEGYVATVLIQKISASCGKETNVSNEREWAEFVY